ncbi:hypothetical protein C9374_014633 [Naegleria lovaniensis]|uniref:DUF676 domain-containing protein n=1 Tax=Naegleria lovaniensis TaxID=51637 RepID=A0AA88H1B5_NAELO|nr:uncharacterized protein C9374_014633 [Naegleria lovaniensis]KAG2389233.1 hypothetical protein C9374_014633 [Naegleria lovaniensis]
MSSTNSLIQHLVVLCHGLQGNTGHLEYIEKELPKMLLKEQEEASLQQQEQFIMLNMSANNNGYLWNWSSTSDGIVQGGKRLLKELSKILSQKYGNDFEHATTDRTACLNTCTLPSRISFIGSSMGGLYCRYMMGELFDEERKTIRVPIMVNTSKSKDEPNERYLSLELMNFIALASPLISVRCLLAPYLYVGLKIAFFWGTGNEMVLEDGNSDKKPFIYEMNDGKSKYFKALEICKKRMTLCSVKQDEDKVPYQTSAIIPLKFGEEHNGMHHSKKCKELVHLKTIHVKHVFVDEPYAFSSLDTMVVGSKKNNFFYFENDSKKDLIFEMIENLRAMEWIRIEIDLYHRQAAVINRNRKDILTVISKLWY